MGGPALELTNTHTRPQSSVSTGTFFTLSDTSILSMDDPRGQTPAQPNGTNYLPRYAVTGSQSLPVLAS